MDQVVQRSQLNTVRSENNGGQHRLSPKTRKGHQHAGYHFSEHRIGIDGALAKLVVQRARCPAGLTRVRFCGERIYLYLYVSLFLEIHDQRTKKMSAPAIGLWSNTVHSGVRMTPGNERVCRELLARSVFVIFRFATTNLRYEGWVSNKSSEYQGSRERKEQRTLFSLRSLLNALRS